jgi:hypothetical protein
MLLADKITFLLVVVASGLGLMGLWVLAAVFWEAKVERCRVMAHGALGKCFLLGMLPMAAVTTILLFSAKAGGVGAFVGLTFLALFLLQCQVGCAGIAIPIGEKLGATSTARAAFLGGGILALLYAIPFIGWVLLFGIGSAIGLGAQIRSLINGLRKKQAVEADG